MMIYPTAMVSVSHQARFAAQGKCDQARPRVSGANGIQPRVRIQASAVMGTSFALREGSLAQIPQPCQPC